MRNSPELTLARLAFKQLTSSKRSLWALLLAALPVLIAIPVGGEIDNPKDGIDNVVSAFQVLTVSVLLPIVALVVGTGIFGAEVEDGTITYALGKPVPRWRMVLTRIVVAGLATAVVLVPATWLSLVIGLRMVPQKPTGLVAACAAAVAVGGLLYCALFVALSLSTKRALVAGLGYVVIWEGLLSRTFAGSRALSIREYTVSFADSIASGDKFSVLPIGTALTMAAVVAVLTTLFAIYRLRRFELGDAV